ncbi:MAG: sugar isomerase [Candidatus Ryanbacteria bacterium RIFCSPHIGHO2_02_FULL_45_43]|uniref:Sugar isomerase n=1 Tax=Candidatus Ryanbacteria bacterium RIFCSPHIGHO2_01_45_13 TaxID=1802112 RepID=A0A1G2FX89_9BACT|nr:MAG: sugar isomerase [Candidatus Ryanbacteria bacterium RIFCSPHIGHO2_01_FULL_44_130]OGZ42695.1 MAG: sugar isomerase [Candidatus Ryanbacteria bacterium RIFCSPHIGHO2_01_45_13]OGZ48817.1 MAG: sugar isomerase [Candidatus Ryanbacteria bacterium RIFCSPHIGHO2_02_FULL_45_43]OGZ50849.1 MAG: sugar isomerase [Candidatus Ryanbacteria bacterium RIFCSPHIGHO2_12_FULL_44_20]OGZ52060.1 MAG: sugar isomerase [Candidatus Ryanbacteria bacterium RIFCSPLOWO2_01_FULL_44_230]OGZ54134.1 MAG: sugar isomerase [Candida
MKYSDYIDRYLKEVAEISVSIDRNAIHKTIALLKNLKEKNGRLFVIGVGGSAANASHAVNDFRKMCKIEAYAPTDNVSELTAWTNDSSFHVVFEEWLKESHVKSGDAVMVLSVGGGSDTVSQNIVRALKYAKETGAVILGIVSRDGGATAKLADAVILVPVVHEKRITPHAEEWQVVVWHLLANALLERHV